MGLCGRAYLDSRACHFGDFYLPGGLGAPVGIGASAIWDSACGTVPGVLSSCGVARCLVLLFRLVRVAQTFRVGLRFCVASCFPLVSGPRDESFFAVMCRIHLCCWARVFGSCWLAFYRIVELADAVSTCLAAGGFGTWQFSLS